MTTSFPRLALMTLTVLGGLATAAHAQGYSANSSTAAPGGVNGGSTQQSIKGLSQAPTAQIFGTPMVVNSPVMSPYNADSTYTTYQGQPASGPSAMLAATVEGAP